ncbi:MAG: hypothetical protein KGJ06_01140 [Pseudomonadota bacterium]|nr:hypothetical protein [Pseudomonadota bacterium]
MINPSVFRVMPLNPDPRFNAFFMLTGVTFSAFASGFGVCLFNLDTVGSCVAVANSWMGTFQAMGDHLIAWGIALVKAAFHQ